MKTDSKISRHAVALLATGLVLLALGAAGGWWWADRTRMESIPTEDASKVGAESATARVLYWYDPMAPQQHFDKPGKSPFMDMELVPKYADDADTSSVQIDPQIRQNLGIRVASVEQISLDTVVEVTGMVEFNERNLTIEQVRAAGFVERVWPLAAGDLITVGQSLLALRVPEWTAAQHEWLGVRDSGDAVLLRAAHERLQQLGMSAEHIQQLEQTGKPAATFVLKANKSGVLQSLETRAGMSLSAGQTVARINGLTTVWLEAALPEAQADGIREGDAIEAMLPAFPGKRFTGHVSAILPALNENSRSLRLRIELPNRDYLLRPGMSARVKLQGSNGETGLAIATEAIIRTGKRALVIVADADNRFTPVEVIPGREIGDRTVIVSGLEAQQQVVVSGQFLIDSEANLRNVVTRLAEASTSTSIIEQDDPTMALHQADGMIEAIEGNRLTLKHGPFKTLGMPGMTMTFPVAHPELIRAFHVGDKVRVGVRETDDGLTIEQIIPLDPQQTTGVQP
ncbi:efflux RND transporter periplasmic adaptor subunit [Permianibacter sp. IMCC34836]|uniref:efflux RND transporter periplasmic adaptor subunit n=1 Tax=Permianibacter fluminis TaxID=2738515 RepID=UPI00155459B4|nr:efflux RND transporter periplasmic adaptor subunit [Permianibacter fluminis]NQD37637.1 efflux RND transporter periplasmic adaptor subunit [Permianibacter fluminis]